MNRSFRATESQMQAMKQRPQLGSVRRPMMKEKEEELAMFLEMRKREKERDSLLHQSADDFDAPLGSKPGTSPIFNIASPPASRRTGADDFLNADNDKNDYDWLLTPPGTPLFPSLEMESQRTVMSQTGTPKARPTALKSRLANPQLEPPPRNNFLSRQSSSSPGLNTSSAGLRRPSSSGGPGSRPATPTGRATLTSSSSKPTLTKTTSTTASRSASATVSRPARSSTPTRTTLPSTKPTTVPARSSTPTSRTTARSSTPTRSSAPPSRTTSRASTPTRRPGTPSSLTNAAPPIVKSSVPSLSRPGSAAGRNPVGPPRASSPTVKSRPWKPQEMPGFSLDAPPNLRTSLADRPPSATRGRPGAPSSRSSSVEPVPNGRGRRQSCSPSRGRPPNGMMHGGGSSVPAVNRAYAKANEIVSPGMMGTKMVERVINMRKLMPPRVDDKHSPRSNLSGKSSSPDSTGFGRTLSKKSLDMAIRHMGIRRTIPGNLRPLMTNVPASSMYSVRTGPARAGRTVSVSDSPLATSSNASSDVSFNNGMYLDGSEAEDDANSERGGNRSPASVRGR